MVSKKRNLRANIIILVGIVGIAAILLISSYQYSNLISNKIADIAANEVRSNARIEVHDISQILANKLETVGALVQTLAESPAVHNNEYTRAHIVINTRQQSSSNLTDFYMWLNRDGKINWISNINQSTYQKYKGTSLSYRPYFTVPKATHTEYYSSLISSNDRIPRLYISYPVINMTGSSVNGNGTFTGLVVASVRLGALGDFLNNQLSPQFNGTIGLLDRNGIILYATGGQQYAGENVFGNNFQSVLSSLLHPAGSRILLNELLKKSLQGNTGSADILINGKVNTIAYQPVVVNGKNFLTLYITAQHTLARDASALVGQQQSFTILIIATIGAVAFIIAFLVFSWNKRLEAVVNARTGELKQANDSLAKSNKQLAIANEQLKTHDKMQNEFINIASHEMKTPTQAILGYSTLIQRHPEKQNEMIQAISRNAIRLQRLTKDILDVTRIETQSLKLNIAKANLKKLISEIIEDQRSEIKAANKDINLVFEPYDGDIEIDADKSRLAQVISNLISNAIKFTKKGIIRVDVETKDGSAIISVRDTGQGIDPEIYPRIFSKFAAKSETGTGLGLFISKSIVEAHGGKVWAQNNSSNRTDVLNRKEGDGFEEGATFAFSIPINKPIDERNRYGEK
jgi:signal transduction histidine kinase